MKKFISNFPFKILALLLSLILWLYVTGELERGLLWKAKEMTFTDIPIKILGLPEKEFKVDVKPDKADIILYSQTRNVENITRDNITLFINVSDLDPGTYELYIQNIIPKDFSISRIRPSSVIITIQDNYIVPFTSDTLER